MSLYGDYILEREKKAIIEDDKGFITFTHLPDETFYVEDLYVRPEFRQQGHAKVLFKQVETMAKEMECKQIMTTVKPSAFGSTISLKVILTAGFQLLRANHDAIFFLKGVDDGTNS